MKKEREKEKEDLSRSGLLAIREGPPHGILSRNRRISAWVPIAVVRYCKLQSAAACSICVRRAENWNWASIASPRNTVKYIRNISKFIVSYTRRNVLFRIIPCDKIILYPTNIAKFYTNKYFFRNFACMCIY